MAAYATALISIYLDISTAECATEAEPLAQSIWLLEQLPNYIQHQFIIIYNIYKISMKINDDTQVHIELNWVWLYQAMLLATVILFE